MSEIAQFYEGKNVFITGATGFVGKVLLEKLLYSCSDVDTVYLLIRKTTAKTTGTNIDRFQELLQSKGFERLRKKHPKALSKLVPIWGDIMKPRLGMSINDENLLIEKASIIFHSAATVKFNEPLSRAVGINLIGTKMILELFKKLRHQDALVYVSTAYANCHRDTTSEKVYTTPISPNFMADAYDKIDAKIMDHLTDAISEGRPNTYTISKALAESYLETNCDNLPISIVRPSIVGNASAEPSKGWGDSPSLVSLTLHTIGLGLVHNLPVNNDAVFDVIPVDFVANLLLAVAWRTFNKNRPDVKYLPVYHCVTGSDNGITFRRFGDFALDYADKNPSTLTINWPYCNFYTNPVLVLVFKIAHHYIPALMADSIRFCKGKKPKYFQMYRKFFSVLPMKTFFLQRHFNFECGNTLGLYSKLGPIDQKTFNFDVRTIEWGEYLNDWFQAMRTFYYPNEINNHAVARKKFQRLYWGFVVFNIVVFGGMAAPFAMALFYCINYVF